MVQYSVIIPVFNGENTISPLFNGLKNIFDLRGNTFEVIFVWDCGPDESWSVIMKLKQEFPTYIKAIRLTRNFGQHNAIISGFSAAKGDFILTLDEDMQHNPSDIVALINTQKEFDFDVVYGRYKSLNHNWFRNITSIILKKVIKLGIPEIHKDYSAFRLIKASIAKETLNMQNSYTFLDGYLSWITTNFGSCDVSHYQRKEVEVLIL